MAGMKTIWAVASNVFDANSDGLLAVKNAGHNGDEDGRVSSKSGAVDKNTYLAGTATAEDSDSKSDVPDTDPISSVLGNTGNDPVDKLNLMFSRFRDLSQQDQDNFTRAEVAEYDGKQGRSLFIIVDSLVYDITEFSPVHPGGQQVLKDHGGQDVTQEMRDSPMPAVVYTNFLKLFQVGRVVD